MKITDGLGVDVSMEMAGPNSSVNNSIAATRRGGDVVLFGLKSGDFAIENYDAFIARGLTLHAVIGRRVFETWQTTKELLENGDGIQDNIYNVILERGQGTILPFEDYSKELFEQKMAEHPKILLKF